jgi:hypothetical protein
MPVICEFLQSASVFVPFKPLQPSLMFAFKARAYLSEGPFHSKVGIRHYQQTWQEIHARYEHSSLL